MILWDDIKHNPPPEMKISPLVVIPHKSHLFRAILDLSFAICLASGKIIELANKTTKKTAPHGVINQLGHSLMHIIHAFAEADDNTKTFMAKGGIKDGFWRLDYKEGEESILCYVLPQPSGKPTQIVVPISL